MKYAIAVLRLLLEDFQSSLDTLVEAAQDDENQTDDFMLSVLNYEMQIEEIKTAIRILDNYKG